MGIEIDDRSGAWEMRHMTGVLLGKRTWIEKKSWVREKIWMAGVVHGARDG